MNVVFVNPPIRLGRVFAHYPMLSTLGMLSNAAWARSRGHNIAAVDAFSCTKRLALRELTAEVRQVGVRPEELAQRTADQVAAMPGPTAVVVAVTMFSDLNRMHETLIEPTLRAIRGALPHVSIGLADLHICGMNYFPYDAPRVLERIADADWILVGEGEPTLPDLLQRIDSGAGLQGLARVAWRDPSGAAHFDPAAPEPIAELDSLPVPAFDLLDMEQYFSTLRDAIEADLVHEYHLPERLLPLMTSRGCPYRCSFCTNQVLALPWRAHSVGYVTAAIQALRQRYQVDRFLLLDDNINADADRFQALVNALAQLRVPWDAVNGYRADRLDREKVRAIKAAGNTKITVSAESGDPELLRTTLRKGLKLSSVVDVARICDQERIALQVHYMVGVPGETRAGINKTLEFATMLFEQHGAWPLLQHAIAFPGTQLFRDCEQHGWFAEPPLSVPTERLEVDSILRTADFEPSEVIRMKRNAQHLHASIQRMALIQVETRCENACLSCHCAASNGDQQEAGCELDAIRQRLDRARFLGARELILSGGEPTMRSDLSSLISLAHAMGFERVVLATNAQGLGDRATARRVIGAGVDAMVLDLHGPEASTHDAVAGRGGAWSATLRGLDEALKAGLKRIEINVALTRRNVHRLDATLRLARKLRVAAVHLQVPGPESQALALGEVPAWSELRSILADLFSHWGQGFATVQGAPLCLFPELPGAIRPCPPWKLQRERVSKARLTQCLDCVAYVLCGGPYRPELDASYGMMQWLGWSGGER